MKISELDTKPQLCPLCAHEDAPCFYVDRNFFQSVRHFYRCAHCGLHFVSEGEHIAFEEEKERYHLHINSPQDEGYIQFLRQLTDPLRTYLSEGDRGLDFGCGPGPAIKSILEPEFSVKEYDPYFLDHPEVLECCYDFVVSTEVIEHFRAPRQDFEKLDRLVKPGGLIGLMTDMRAADIDFASWGYKNDPTHIMFYTPKTIDYIAKKFKWKVLQCDTRIAILQK